MRTLVRIRQLASGEYAVQVVCLLKGQHVNNNKNWVDHAKFTNEREAEMHARGLVDGYAAQLLGQPRSEDSCRKTLSRQSGKYWLYPRRDCRVNLG